MSEYLGTRGYRGLRSDRILPCRFDIRFIGEAISDGRLINALPSSYGFSHLPGLKAYIHTCVLVDGCLWSCLTVFDIHLNFPGCTSLWPRASVRFLSCGKLKTELRLFQVPQNAAQSAVWFPSESGQERCTQLRIHMYRSTRFIVPSPLDSSISRIAISCETALRSFAPQYVASGVASRCPGPVARTTSGAGSTLRSHRGVYVLMSNRPSLCPEKMHVAVSGCESLSALDHRRRRHRGVTLEAHGRGTENRRSHTASRREPLEDPDPDRSRSSVTWRKWPSHGRPLRPHQNVGFAARRRSRANIARRSSRWLYRQTYSFRYPWSHFGETA